MRLRAALVQRLAAQPARQGRRDDAEEAHSLRDAARTSRVQLAEPAARAHALRAQGRRYQRRRSHGVRQRAGQAHRTSHGSPGAQAVPHVNRARRLNAVATAG